MPLGVVVYACNHSTWEAETGGLQFGDQPQQFSETLSKLVRPCFKKQNKKKNRQPGVAAHACNHSTWEAETGGSQVRNQSQQLSEALHNFVRPGFKIKYKKIGPGV